jgi:hypothetical protein
MSTSHGSGPKIGETRKSIGRKYSCWKRVHNPSPMIFVYSMSYKILNIQENNIYSYYELKRRLIHNLINWVKENTYSWSFFKIIFVYDHINIFCITLHIMEKQSISTHNIIPNIVGFEQCTTLKKKRSYTKHKKGFVGTTKPYKHLKNCFESFVVLYGTKKGFRIRFNSRNPLIIS